MEEVWYELQVHEEMPCPNFDRRRPSDALSMETVQKASEFFSQGLTNL